MRDALTRVIVLSFRFGLSWLVGRRLLVLTTTERADGGWRRTALPFRWSGGELHLTHREGAHWFADLAARPVAMAQAAPGPLAVRARRQGDGVALVATGQPAPPPVVPDLYWVGPAVFALWLALRTARRRRRR